jgi:hypothetical protein
MASEDGKSRKAPERVTLYHISTGEPVEVFQVDARELMDSGEYTESKAKIKKAPDGK